MRNWKQLSDDQKDGRWYLLATPEKKVGPYIGYFWQPGNTWLGAYSPSPSWQPTHYDDLDGLIL